MNKIKADVLVFDQGNTLVLDPFKEVLQRSEKEIARVLAAYKIDIPAKELIQSWELSNRSIEYPYISHFWQEEPIVIDALEKLSVDFMIADLLSLDLLLLYRQRVKKVVGESKKNTEIQMVLEYFHKKRKKIGIFSNDRKIDLENNLKLLRIRKYFSYVYTSEALHIQKPSLEVFEHIFQYFGVQRNRVAYIGDEPMKDVEPVKKFGFKAILYKPGEEYHEKWRDYRVQTTHKPDAIINTLSDLIEIIE